jgi:PAS domain S-box-containing protein
MEASWWAPLSNINEPLIVLDKDYKIVWLSYPVFRYIDIRRKPKDRPFCEIFSQMPEEHCPVMDFFVDESSISIDNPFKGMIDKNNEYEFSLSPIGDKNTPSGWLVAIRDISNSKRMEDYLKMTYNLFQSFFEGYPSAVVIVDKNLDILNFNERGRNLLSLDFAHYIKPICSIPFFSKMARLEPAIRETISSGRVDHFDYKVENGGYFRISIFPLDRSDEDSVQIAVSVSDISEELRMERDIILLYSAIESSMESFAILDRSFKLIYVNNTFLKMFSKNMKLEGVIGKTLFDVFSHNDVFDFFRKDVEANLLKHEHFSCDVACKKDERHIVLDLDISGINLVTYDFSGYLLTIRDVTRQKVIENKIHETQKLERMIELSRGFIHDFRNLLSSLQGSAQIIAKKIDKSDPSGIGKYVDILQRSIKTSVGILQNLQLFENQEALELKPVNIRDVIDHVLNIILPSVPETIRVKNNVPHDIPEILADSTKLEEIFLNLILNGVEAMPSGGLLTIGSSLVRMLEADLWNVPEALEGDYLRITIQDEGVGIPPEFRARIFEPLFSTKKGRIGSGMGLAIVFSSVKAHKGFITVDSIMGKGTVFNVYLLVKTKDEK